MSKFVSHNEISSPIPISKIIVLIDNKEEDDDNYDEVNEQQSGEIYGNIDEEIEFQTMQNPYYGGEIDDGPTIVKTSQNPYYGGEL